MAKTVEVLDALMGSGKTHSIIDYMSKHQDRPWLYISPMLDEVDTRVPNRAIELGFELFVPSEDKATTKSQNCLDALRLGLNICCTHSLMYKFTKDHLHEIKQQGYNVVSDEELNLINGYNVKKDDIDFLLSNNLIRVDDKTGAVEFLDEKMSLDARYGDVKSKADLGMLYAAKRSTKFMVVQLSPKIIDCSERFILLTYNYQNSLMQTFLKLHGYEYKSFDEVKLYKTDEEIKKDLLERIEFIETPSVKKIQAKYALSKSWWITAGKEQRRDVSKCIRACLKYSGAAKQELFYTIPKDYACQSKGFETKFIGRDAYVNEDGEVVEMSRTFVACNARSTNKYEDKTLAVQAYNLFPNQSVKAFIQGQGEVVNDDVFALNMLLQWLFRGCIRKKGTEKLKVAILSKRMSTLFKEWLMKNQK
jgi:hypothetical protein